MSNLNAKNTEKGNSKYKAEISEIEDACTIVKINKAKRLFIEKINKIDKCLVLFLKKI